MTSSASGIVFSTGRIVARALTSSDQGDLFAVYGDRIAMRWVGDGAPLSLEQCVHWIGVTRRNYAARGYGMYALVHRQSGQSLGFIGLVHPDQQPEPELKYAFRRSCWGQGLATEAAIGLLHYSRHALGITRVVATVAPENQASRRVLEKIGMHPIKTYRDADGLPTCLYAWEAGDTSGRSG